MEVEIKICPPGFAWGYIPDNRGFCNEIYDLENEIKNVSQPLLTRIIQKHKGTIAVNKYEYKMMMGALKKKEKSLINYKDIYAS